MANIAQRMRPVAEPMRLLEAFLILLNLHFVTCNEVVGQPFISCSADAIYAKWKTKSTFTGHVNVRYAPNRYCYQVLVTNNQIELLIPHQDCQVNRIRSLHPRGVIIEASVLISFHAEYVTLGDRIYVLQCVHSRAPDHSLLPGIVPTTALQSGVMRGPVTSPRCEYRIRNPSDDSLIERAAIGDVVRHEWSCKTRPEADLCLVVTSCYLLTSDSKHRLINEQGCSTDASVLPELHYVNKLEVSQNVSTFGIAQKPYIRFQCQLSLVPSQNGTCQRPNCSMRSRMRKDVHSLLEADDAKILDAVSQELEIVEFGHNAERDSHRTKCNSATLVEKITSEEVVCVSRLSFGIVAISTILVAICTLLVVVISMVQRFHFGEIRVG